MIKKYLLLLGIVFLGFFGFTNAQTFGDLPLSFYQGNSYNIIDTDLNFENIGNDYVSYNSLYFSFSDGTKKYIFWNNGKLYFYSFYGYNNSLVQGFYNKVCLIHSDDGTFEGNFCQNSDYQDISIFYNLQDPNFTNAWVYPEGGIGNLCIYDSNSKYYYCFNVELLTGSLNIPINSDLSYVSQYLGNSFFSGGNNNYNPGEIENITGDVELIAGSIDSYIDYYETRYNWDEGLCYIGTNDLTGAYGKSGVNFEYGSGATIFELYNTMYGTFGSNIISNVGSFINCWFINYNQWFYTVQDERSYKCIYNGPDTNITLDYEDLTFPFRNNRVAIYFMVDNLFDSMPEQSMGEHFAYYCMMKLNYDNYKNGSLNFQDLQDKVNPKILDRIDDYNNTRLPNYQGFSVPDMSGNTNIWGNLIQTGSGIPQDLNPTDLFKQFYNKINSLLQNFNPARAVGIIPLWILYPMLFLILFRILRH